MPNRLAAEASPYLLQHKDNPVDWYPWGDAAFTRAQEDKPIFLSIGYSTCHWCHVMEHESFEEPNLAELLNRHFVSIKVDREERPDVDRVYMTFVQATTGSGGWPMSVWLTPSLQPFYGGTYFPPTSRWGKPGFAEVLEEIARVWREARQGHPIGREHRRTAPCVWRPARRGEVPPAPVLERATAEFAAAFDARRGGWQRAEVPAAERAPVPAAGARACAGGRAARYGAAHPAGDGARRMRDHIGGGFHRYSVDADWRVPHFEKMLCDQAQLTLAYAEAAQVTGDRFYADVAFDTLAYVRRDLTDAEGGFYSAEDADSIRLSTPAMPARTRWKARSTSGPMRKSGTSSASTRMPFASASASVPAATRRSIRRTSLPTRTCCIRLGRWPTSRRRRVYPRSRSLRCSKAPGRRCSSGVRCGRGRISTTRS